MRNKKIAIFLIMLILLGGCTGGSKRRRPTTTTTTPSETTTETTTTTPSRPSSTSSSNIKLKVEPLTSTQVYPLDQLVLLATVRNTASMSNDYDKNEINTLRDVSVLFYNFGSDFIGCSPADIYVGDLEPEEEREVECVITAPEIEATQEIKVRAYYAYDLYAEIEDIVVLDSSEYTRRSPSVREKTASSDGILSMDFTISSVPLRAGSTSRAKIELTTRTSSDMGIAEKEDMGIKYNIEILQIQLPSGWDAPNTGGLMKTSEGLMGEKIIIRGDTREYPFSIRAPDISVPEETYTISAVATGFEAFLEDSIDISAKEME